MLWRQGAIDRGLYVKPGLEHLGNYQTEDTQVRGQMPNAASEQGLQFLLKL